MSTPNPIFATIIIIFALQAIVLSVLLIRKRPGSQSNIFLSLLVFFFALMALNIGLINILITYDVFFAFRYVQLELLFGIGPALYFYTRSFTDSSFAFSRKDFIHFVPVILEFLFYRTAFYRLGADGMYQTPVHPYTKIYLTEQWLGILSITVYTIVSIRIIYKYQIWLKEHYSNLENKSLNWLKLPVLIFSSYWIGWNILTEIDRFAFNGELREYYFLPTFIGLAITTYWIGLKGYINSGQDTHGFESEKESKGTPYDPEFAAKLTALMEEKKPYLDPDLDLSKLSDLSGLASRQVSQTINQGFSKNFYEYINQYRVEAFKKRVLQSGADKFTLLGHAFESGFKSKSTFNEVFKKTTGMTPTEYIKRLKK